MQSHPTAFDQLYIQAPRRWLVVISILYLLLAANYAIATPPWQAPDEPAHYNNIAEIYFTQSLPVLEQDDYNQAVQADLISAGFPAQKSREQFRYESYQPPLYYLLATPIFALTGGSLAALRLFSVLLGLGTILLIYRCGELVFREKTLITLGATAFAALLPMQVAMTAAVNNDSLAHLLVAATLFLLLRWMRPYFYVDENAKNLNLQTGSLGRDLSGFGNLTGLPVANMQTGASARAKPALLWLGIVLGLGLLTKIYAYILLPICALTVLCTVWRSQPNGRFGQGLLAALRVCVPALLLGLPLWMRNWRLYGAWDILGTLWHDQVVAGQPRTADWIADQGWVAYSERAVTLTFKSFWGVFGWLGIFLDERIYTACLVFSGVLFLGLLWALVRWVAGDIDVDLDRFQRWVIGLFAIMIFAVLAGYVWYNAKFVQHQGRYFFWGLLPISTFVAVGWREVLRPLQGVITGCLTGVLAGALAVSGYIGGALDKWTVLIAGGFALFLLVQPILLWDSDQPATGWRLRVQTGLNRPLARWTVAFLRLCAFALPFVLLLILNLLIPGLFILPQLRY